MKGIHLALVYAAALALALAATTPLNVGLAAARLESVSAEAVEGTLWRGRLLRGRAAGLELGDLAIRVSLLALLTGAGRADVEAGGEAVRGRARLLAGRGGEGLEAATVSGPLSALGFASPLSGEVKLQDAAAVFEGDACRRAGGRVLVQLRGLGSGVTELAGQPRCENDKWVLVAEGERDGAPVRLRWRLAADGRYQGEVRIVTSDPALGEALRRSGFSQTGAAYVRASQGSLR